MNRIVFRHLFGANVPADEAFHAWTSNDLDRMVRAVAVATNGVDLHYLYLNIAKLALARQQEPECALICEQFARRHIAEFAKLQIDLDRDRSDSESTFRHYPAYQELVELLMRQGRGSEAVEICQQAFAATGWQYFADRLGLTQRLPWSELREAILQRAGILQSDFCRLYDAQDVDFIRTQLYWAAKRGDLIRIKSGRSLKLEIPQ